MEFNDPQQAVEKLLRYCQQDSGCTCCVTRAIFLFDAMRKSDLTQHALFSYRTQEQRIPEAHPLLKLHILVDAILQNMRADLEALYSRRGRPLIAPERLLRTSLSQTLFTIRSERQWRHVASAWPESGGRRSSPSQPAT